MANRPFPARLRAVALAALLCCPLLAPGQPARPAGPATLVLVATPDLNDGNFGRSIVLVTRTPASELIGLILNRPTDTPWPPGLQPLPKTADPRVYFGGPLATNALFAIGTTPDDVAGTLDLGGGLRLAVGVRNVLALAAARPPARAVARLKLFRGYAGWGPGQLRAEIDAGAWTVERPSAALVFDRRPASQWERLTVSARLVRAPIAPPGLKGGFGPDEVSAVDRLHANVFDFVALLHL